MAINDYWQKTLAYFGMSDDGYDEYDEYDDYDEGHDVETNAVPYQHLNLPTNSRLTYHDCLTAFEDTRDAKLY